MHALPLPPDPRSFALACLLASLFLAAVMGSLRNPWVETRGAPWFAGSALAAAGSFLLVGLAPAAGWLPLVALRAGSTVLLFGLLVAGLCRFCGRPVPWLALAASLLLMSLVVVMYPDSRDDVAPRVLAFSLLITGWSLGGAWLLWRHPVLALPRPGPWLTGIGLAGLAVVAMLRSLLLLGHGPVSGDEALHAPLNAWLLPAGFAALLLTHCGCALMLNARQVQELMRFSSHDPLTGLFNRRGFNAHWPAWLRAQGPGHVVLMDLQGAPDTTGLPEAGLLALVQVLRTLAPADALLARQGGGSFLAALPEAWRDAQVRDWSEQLQHELAARLALVWSEAGSGLHLRIGHAPVQQGGLADAARRASFAMQRGPAPHAAR
jgi:GGDEF domain-containing protein